MQAYDEHSITVLTPAQARQRHAYATTADLCAKYPHVSPVFVARLVEAGRQVGELDAAVRRYLDGDKSVTVSEEMLAAYAEARR